MSKYLHIKPLKLRTSLWFNFKLLHILGFWPPEDTKTLIFIVSFMYVMYLTSEIINVALSTSDIEKITDASFLLLTHMAQVIKVYCFIKKRRLILDLLKMMDEEIFQPINEKQYKMIKDIMDSSAIYYYIFLCMAVGTVSLWGAFPVLDKEETELHLPLSAWYPFKTNKSPIFEIIYAYQLIAVISDAVSNISKDCTITGLMAHVCAQLDILNDTLENIKEYSVKLLAKEHEHSGNESSNSRIFEKTEIQVLDQDLITDKNLELSDVNVSPTLQNEMNQLLVRCIHHHRRIIDMANLIQNIFNKSVLVQFIISAIIICITMFELTLVSLLSLQFFSMVLYQGCMLLEIILYCWYGNEIILKSNTLSNSAYYSEWTDCSIKYKKELLFIMVRSKIPIKIYAGDFFSLSLETFSAIIRSSWSYFAVLRQVHQK